MQFKIVLARLLSGESGKKKRRLEMKSSMGWIVVIGLLAVSLLLGACGRGPDTGHVGPKGILGPQGDVGPRGDLGASSKNAITIKRTGEPVKSEYALSGFSEVEVCDFFEAEVRQGDTHRVTVEAEETLMPYIEVFVRGETLHVGLKSGYAFNMEDVTQRVALTLPTMACARVNNHGTLNLKDFRSDDALKLEVNDFSELSGTIAAESVQVETSNHSTLSLTGSASQVRGELTDFSDADLTGLEAGEVDIDTDTHSTLSQ